MISGFIRNNYRLVAVSLLVVFLYGSMVWGIFPLQRGISWESHAAGALSGLILAYFYRDYQVPIPVQEPPTPQEVTADIEKLEARFGERYWDPDSNDTGTQKIVYTFKPEDAKG
jgi:hypothetical protein